MYNSGDCIQIIDTDRESDSVSVVTPPTHRRSVRRVVPSVEVLHKHADVVAVPTAQGLALSKTRKGWNNGLLLVGGIHRHWNFQILEGTKITCGVCTGDVDLDGYVNKTNKGWGLYALYGTCGTAGPAKTRCCDPVQIGDIINVFLFQNTDPNFHTLAFAINGKKPIASYKLPINITYYGAVSLYSASDRVVVTTGTPLSRPQGEYGSTPPPVATRPIARLTSQKSGLSAGSRMSVSSRVSSVASAR